MRFQIPSRPPLNLTRIFLSIYFERSSIDSFLGFVSCAKVLPPLPPPLPPPLEPRGTPLPLTFQRKNKLIN
jgi:hypothetical protein